MFLDRKENLPGKRGPWWYISLRTPGRPGQSPPFSWRNGGRECGRLPGDNGPLSCWVGHWAPKLRSCGCRDPLGAELHQSEEGRHS